VFRKNSQAITVRPNQSTTYTASRDVQLPPGDADHVVVSADSSQALTNKTIDSDLNTITNIVNADIKAGAGIAFSKLANVLAGNVLVGNGSGVLSSVALTGDISNDSSGVTSINAGVIVNADVNANAGINATKIATGLVNNTQFNKVATAGSDATGEFVTTDNSQTLTGKTISGASNTLSSIPNSATTATAANTASAIVARDASGNFSAGTITAALSGNATTATTASNVSGTVAIANGGTGQTSQTAAFDALAPTTTKGDLVAHNGTDNVRVAVGANGQVLVADSTAPAGVTWSDGGAGGSGELNAVQNPSAASATIGWSVGISHTVTRLTSGSPLDPLVDTAFQFSASASASESSTSGCYYPISDVSDGLLNKKLKVEFYCQVPSSDAWRLSVYQSTTRLNLSTDSSSVTTLPAGFVGKFTAYFDTSSSAAYSVNFTKTSHSGANNLIVTNVIVGPGIQPQGAVVGPWTAFTPAWSSSLIASGAGSSNVGFYRRLGDSMEVSFGGNTGASGSVSGLVYLNMPTGFTIDTTKLTDSAGKSSQLGKAVFGRTAATAKEQQVSVRARDSSSINFTYDDSTSTNYNPTGGTALGANDYWRGSFVVPIAEWAGSGTVNVVQNDVEYAYNTSTSTSTDTTSFGYGPDGASVQAFAPAATASIQKRVRFQTPIQATDAIRLEFLTTNNCWLPVSEAGANYMGLYDGTTQRYVGAIAYPVNSTDVDVYFYSGAFWQAADSTVRTWTEHLAAYPKWRVRKVSGGQAVGFGRASEETSGLVSREYTETYSTTFSDNGTGPGTSSSVSIVLQRVGSFVTAYIPAFSLTTGSGTPNIITAGTAMPAWARPASNQRVWGGQVYANNVTLDETPQWVVPTTGILSLRRDAGGSSFGASLPNTGLEVATTLTWYAP